MQRNKHTKTLFSSTEREKIISGVFKKYLAVIRVFWRIGKKVGIALSLFFCFPVVHSASAFTFPLDEGIFYGTNQKTTTSDTIDLSGPTTISGSFEVQASLIIPTGGEVDEVIVHGDSAITLSYGDAPITVLSSYDFTASGGVLSLDIEPVSDKYGTGTIVFTILGTSDGDISGNLEVDTRLMAGENFGTHRYGEDPWGNLIDFNSDGGGVNVSDTRVTGMIWSECCGWIDLQAPYSGGGITVEVVSDQRANLSGNAWNPNFGWISFGPIDDQGGVYIDEEGYFHGTAYSENFGSLSFGNYMELNPGAVLQPTETLPTQQTTSWAQTSWRIPVNHAPTVTLISPSSDPDGLSPLVTRTPTLTFRPNDEDADLDKTEGIRVRYALYLQQKASDGSWSPAPGSPFLHNTADIDVGSNYDHTFTDALLPGDYRWSVEVVDDLNLSSGISAPWYFTIPNDAPSSELIYPIGGETVTAGLQNIDGDDYTVNNRRPPFVFTITENSGDSIRYRIEISDDNFSTILPQSSNFSGYFIQAQNTVKYVYTPPSNLPSGTLSWRIVGEDSLGLQDISPVETFVISNANPIIDYFQMLDNNNFVIPDGGDTIDTAPTISWRAEDPDGARVTTTATILDGATIIQQISYEHLNGYQEYTLSPLVPGIYTYHIEVCDSDGDCVQSADKTLTILGALDRLGNIGTANIALITPERLFAPDSISTNNRFAWNDTVGWIDMNPASGGVIVFQDDLRGFAWNDTVGWIRFHCNLDNTGFLGINNECDTNNYGVINEDGQLSGKALIESSGKYIYFDEQSYLDDFGGNQGDHSDIDADISCDADKGGHFLGRAWSPDLGWIAYGWEEIFAHGGTEEDAKDVFPITEWACTTEGPQPIEDNKFYVFGATSDDLSYPIAEKSGVTGAGNLACVNGVGGTNIAVHRMLPNPTDNNSNGTIEDSETWDYALDVTDFSIGCENPDGNTDGKLWITISDGVHGSNTTPGIYRISGVIGDSNGNNLELPTDENSENTHNFENEWIFQVVAGVPDLTHGDTIAIAKFDSNGLLSENLSLVADGDDTTKVILTPYDAFGNPVIKEYKYQDSEKDVIKTVKLRSVFHDTIKIDQIEPTTSPIRNAVTFSTPQQEAGAPIFDGSSNTPAIFYLQNTDAAAPTIITEFSSVAPTGKSNTIELSRIEVSVEQKLPSTEPLSVGQTDDWSPEVFTNQTFSYRPIFESTTLNFADFANLENVENELLLKFQNNSNIVDIDAFDWAGALRTKLSGLPAGTVFRDTHLLWDNPETQTLRNDYYQEVSSISTSYLPGMLSLFQNTLLKKLGEKVTEIVGQSLNYTITDRKFPSIDAGAEFSFSLIATPDTSEEIEGEQTEFLQYFAWNTGEKVVKYPLIESQRLTAPGGLRVSVSGSVHGDQINESGIVGESSAFSEFSVVGQIYERRDIRKILYENYREITGNLTPEPNNGTIDTQKETIEGWDDLDFLRNSENNRSLQDGKVIWFVNNDTTNQNTNLSVILGKPVGTGIGKWDPLQDFGEGDSFHILPASAGEQPYTITVIVYGGNLYIRNNIYTSSSSNIGFIVLSSQEARADCYKSPKGGRCGKEGNIFIHPDVTHIEGVFYADGSVMSSNDNNNDGNVDSTDGDGIIQEDEIIDGFTSEADRVDFSNQLYVKGSFASQNITGTLGVQGGDVELPSEVLLPRDCGSPPTIEGCGTTTDQKKAAQRFDLSYLRQYRLLNVFTDADGDGITNDKDCDSIPEEDRETSGCICTDDQCYNPSCEDAYEETKSPLPSDCVPLFVGKTTTGEGRCAAGTKWCPPGITGEKYNIDCSDISTDLGGGITPANICSTGGDDVANQKAEAALVIEYDPKVKKLTPVGMNLPPVVNFEKQ
ncbi:hypothetical protein IPN35_06095 [Candidatus Peregrinibacteria bacterium]|nr:MAG: hypothetical protein IPN35_06095 [Candidatus Peregrinibacteria bacterium]